MADSKYCEPWRGTSTGLATSPVLESLPRLINNFQIVNKTAGTIGVSVYLFTNSSSVAIAPINKQITAGEIYSDDIPKIQLVTEQIKIQASGDFDYNFTLSNIEL